MTEFTTEGAVTAYRVAGFAAGQTHQFEVSCRDAVGVPTVQWALGPTLTYTVP